MVRAWSRGISVGDAKNFKIVVFSQWCVLFASSAVNAFCRTLYTLEKNHAPACAVKHRKKRAACWTANFVHCTSRTFGSEHNLFSTSCPPQTSRVSCQCGHLTHADTLSEPHEASPLLSATRSACRSNQVVPGNWRLHVHVSALSLWSLKNVRNGRLMWHLSICGGWSGWDAVSFSIVIIFEVAVARTSMLRALRQWARSLRAEVAVDSFRSSWRSL